MKFALITLVAVFCLAQQSEAFWGYGGLYGGLLGYGYGLGLYGGYGGYGGLWGKRDATETETEEMDMPLNRTECVYTKETSMLSCKGLRDIVECQSTLMAEGDIEFELYGLADCEDMDDDKHYRILPRRLDNTAWERDMAGDKRISLYHSKNLDHYGLRINDEECFNRVSELLDASVRREKVWLAAEDMVSKPTAIIRGDLIVADELPEVSKRWFGYGGYRGFGGYGGYRFGGYGGYGGYGYYGKRDNMPAVDKQDLIEKAERDMNTADMLVKAKKSIRADLKVSNDLTSLNKRWYDMVMYSIGGPKPLLRDNNPAVSKQNLIEKPKSEMNNTMLVKNKRGWNMYYANPVQIENKPNLIEKKKSDQ